MTDDILYGHRLHYMGLAALNFQQVCRVVVVHHEDHGDADNLVVVMTDDGAWESSVVHVARDAWAVVVFPADSPGCLRELELLKEHGLLDRVAVYMPASSSWTFKIFAYAIGQPKSVRRYGDDWEELRVSMQSHGYNLPDYDPAGLLYKPLPDFSIRQAVSLKYNELSPKALAQVVAYPNTAKAMPLWTTLLNGRAYEGSDTERRLGGLPHPYNNLKAGMPFQFSLFGPQVIDAEPSKHG